MPSRRGQEAELRLRVVVAVEQRAAPAVVIGAGLDLEAAHREALLVEAVARGERVGPVRLIGETRAT